MTTVDEPNTGSRYTRGGFLRRAGLLRIDTGGIFEDLPRTSDGANTAIIADPRNDGTGRVSFTLDSPITGPTRAYDRFHDAVRNVDWARVLDGFHFRNSDQGGSALGRDVGRYVTTICSDRLAETAERRLR